jgi:hypothetical protein
MLALQAYKLTMPKRKDDFIDWRDDWRNCRAKKQLVNDFSSGFFSLSPTEITAETAHQQRPLYQEVDFSKFKRHFGALQTSVREEKGRADRDSEGLASDQQFSRIDGGEQEEFEALLRQDLQQNLYEILGAKELWLSRPQYQSRCGTLRAFRDLIYAEERRQKRVAKYRREREE